MTKSLLTLEKTLSERGITCKPDHELASYTTWKIGGKADLFATVNSSADLLFAVHEAQKNKIDYTILGWGSNVLISDQGIRGLVIKNASREIKITDAKTDHQIETIEATEPQARLEQVDKENYYSFQDLDYDESEFRSVEVEVDSGVYLPYLINILINKGITGLQWFAGIPGTVGGAVYNNIHGGSHFFSEYVTSVSALNSDGELVDYSKDQMNFEYDYSIFHDNSDVIINIKLALRAGDKDRARETSIAWATRKRLQPANSAGCSFQNIDVETQNRLNLESSSWGYIIDKVLNLKGYRVGKAHISEKHAAFIETDPSAKASDVLAIFEKIHTESQKTLGIVPKAEIFFLGFDDAEISKYR